MQKTTFIIMLTFLNTLRTLYQLGSALLLTNVSLRNHYNVRWQIAT